MSYWEQLAPIVFNGFTGTTAAITVPRDAGGMVMETQFGQGVSIGSTCAYRVVMEWSLNSAFSIIVARRQFVVRAGDAQGGLNPASGGVATMATPHFAEYLRLTLVAPTLTTFQSVTLNITHRAQPLSYWGSPVRSLIATGDTFLNTHALIPFTSGNVLTGASLSASSLWPYEGPAQLVVRNGSGVGVVAAWSLDVNQIDEAGNVDLIASWNAGAVAENRRQMTFPLLVTPATIRVTIFNAEAATRNLGFALNADYSRLAA